jgi:xanthine dehydrogenase accessory factor
VEHPYELIAQALRQGQGAALATVVRVEGSTPRGVGTKMVVYADGRSAGTVGGGEMEALVIREAVDALRQGASRLVRYDLRDTTSGDPGICGGVAEVFVDVARPRPTLLVVGAGHVAVPVAEMGHLCGFRVVVLDDRPDMVSAERFPHADERIAAAGDEDGGLVETLRAWPLSPATHVVIVTRGHAYDEAALRAVIDAPAAYIGMIGSRHKVQTTLDHLRADGVDEAQIRRVHAPIGLDIGAETPAEIALSILAEIVRLRHEPAAGRSAPRQAPSLKLEP